MSATLEATIRKIEALITQADHPNTGQAEAEAFRAKAEALMFKYRIDEMQIKASGEAPTPDSLIPKWQTFTVCEGSSEFRHFYRSMFGFVVKHFDASYEVEYGTNEDGYSVVVAQVVGYESDLRFISVLWQSIRLGFSKRLEPKYDPSLSQEENAYNMRSAGMEGVRIAYAIFGKADKNLRVKVRNMARSYAESIGEDPRVFSGRGNDMKTYRESYANGFHGTIITRLREMARSRQVAESGALVLASRAEQIKEAFYERYPDRRPKPAVEYASASTISDRSECKKCQAAKSGYCRDHQWMKPRQGRARSYNYRAAERGSSAARAVDMGITGRELR